MQQSNKINFISLFLLFFLSACSQSYQPTKNEKLFNALSDESIKIRGEIINIPKGEFRFDYYDFDEKDSSIDELYKRGYQAGGLSWRGIVYGAIRMSNDKMLLKIRFDEEADGLAIWSHDRKILEQIGKLIAVIKDNKEILNECILVAEKNGEME